MLADDLGKRVVIVDTSNEIGGDGDVPHPGIGAARRMQVAASAACSMLKHPLPSPAHNIPCLLNIRDRGGQLFAC